MQVSWKTCKLTYEGCRYFQCNKNDMSVTKIKQALLSKIIAEKNTGKMSLFHISIFRNINFKTGG